MAAIYDFTIEQYATFKRSFTVSDSVTNAPVNLTGFSALMQFRDVNGTVIEQLSTVTGEIVLGVGSIDLNLSALTTGTFNFSKLAHDLVVTGGIPQVSTRFFQGNVKLSLGVSHA